MEDMHSFHMQHDPVGPTRQTCRWQQHYKDAAGEGGLNGGGLPVANRPVVPMLEITVLQYWPMLASRPCSTPKGAEGLLYLLSLAKRATGSKLFSYRRVERGTIMRVVCRPSQNNVREPATLSRGTQPTFKGRLPRLGWIR